MKQRHGISLSCEVLGSMLILGVLAAPRLFGWDGCLDLDFFGIDFSSQGLKTVQIG
jgi:hypothetical protein